MSNKKLREVIVGEGILQVVMNLLARDAEEGKIIRKEILEELRNSIRKLEEE